MTFDFFITVAATLLSFFVIGVVLGAAFSSSFRKKLIKIVEPLLAKRRDLMLAKVVCNPVIEPGTHPWSAEAVFNPAAVALNGRTHLIYRAIGLDGVSRLGYASSGNGILFDERLPYPVFVSTRPRGGVGGPKRYSPVIYPSGGSWGGCEDPRMVAIDGRIYLTFNMFDGWDFIRVALTSISEKDFLAKRWNWTQPLLISPPNQIHKNWVLFPEKVHGKFAVLHSIVPKIEVEYRDALDEIGVTEPFIESWQGPRSSVPGREGAWDTTVRGAGPPPIKTKHGWLLFYHATEAHEGHRYKLGAMLLDLDDPTKVLYRSAHPILLPDEAYENNGKPGIVYACGAVERDGLLYIYYGGADKVVCVAFAPIQAFLTALMNGEHPAFTSHKAQTT